MANCLQIGWLVFLLAIATPVTLAQDAVSSADDSAEPSEPIETDLRENVDVQLILIDAVIMDNDFNTVPDLKREDFKLYIDGRKKPIHSLDISCPEQVMVDPKGGWEERDWSLPPVSKDEPLRKIVLAFDYAHIDRHPIVIEQARNAVEKLHTGNEEQMILTLSNGIRVEQAPTQDHTEVLATLDRMLEDPKLFAGNHSNLTEWPSFERIENVLDVMATMEGRKILILFSGPFNFDGFTHDPAFRRISAMAARSRTQIYPVDTQGLTIGGNWGPETLRRLAVETGGRLTARTNDLGLAYARAQRDFYCVYTFGIIDRNIKWDHERRVSIHVRGRDFLRAHHPDFYVVRSPEKKREAIARTAAMAPELFANADLDAGAAVIDPVVGRRWRTVLSVPLPEQVRNAEKGTWTIRGLVRSETGATYHEFEDEVDAEALVAGNWFDTAKLREGVYRASVVLSAEGKAEPIADAVEFRIPSIPHEGPFVVGPVFGWRNGDRARDFVPLTGPIAPGRPLTALTQVCRIDRQEPYLGRVERRLNGTSLTGGAQPLVLNPARRGACQSFYDEIDTSKLAPGSHTVAVDVSITDGVPISSEAELTVGSRNPS
ncbi:hypothetical protein ABI59_10535 [Acidobacteria bacterium Mor1]|nr:hypothetical protein ABI59_10535 [Acidobacteria bacterium Mor1]